MGIAANLAAASSAANPGNSDDAALWAATRTITVATQNGSVAGDVLPFWQRLGGWAPLGALPVAGLVYTARYRPESLALYTFFHWANQTQIAMMTYLNGSQKDAESVQRLALGYSGAMAAALTIVVGFRGAMARSPLLQRYKRFAPLPAAAAANTANSVLVRSGELETGIPVYAVGNGSSVTEEVGLSRIAAQQAIAETTITRWVLPLGNFIVAPMIMAAVERTAIMTVLPWTSAPLQLLACGFSFCATLPVTFALFPEDTVVDAADLEPEIAAKVSEGSQLRFKRGL